MHKIHPNTSNFQWSIYKYTCFINNYHSFTNSPNGALRAVHPWGDFPNTVERATFIWKTRGITIHLNGQWYCIFEKYTVNIYMAWSLWVDTITFEHVHVWSDMIRINQRYTNLGDTSSLWQWLACNKPHISFNTCFKAQVATWQSKGNRSDQWWGQPADINWWFAPPKCQHVLLMVQKSG